MSLNILAAPLPWEIIPDTDNTGPSSATAESFGFEEPCSIIVHAVRRRGCKSS